MNVTLDQARTLDAFARAGTLQAAARLLHKGHPAVLYALKHLETQTGLALFDRSGYRTRLTAAGDAVLSHCRAMLAAERALKETCSVLQSGWEPVLRVVFDAIVPLTPFLSLVRDVRSAKAPTRVTLSVDSLDGVTQRFEQEQAQVMVTVLPVETSPSLEVRSLPKLRARLVAHRTHPLAKLTKVTPEVLAEHVLLTVRGSDPRLRLATAELDRQSTVHVSDFHSKKAAIAEGLGFGWLPDWLIERELERGELRPLKLTQGAVHVFEPRVVVRTSHAGRASRALVTHLTSQP
ncbi:MAG: LysR family transcriptional regulator [Myxococcaceae bacterium]